jgi:hypothetical protein
MPAAARPVPIKFFKNYRFSTPILSPLIISMSLDS